MYFAIDSLFVNNCVIKANIIEIIKAVGKHCLLPCWPVVTPSPVALSGNDEDFRSFHPATLSLRRPLCMIEILLRQCIILVVSLSSTHTPGAYLDTRVYHPTQLVTIKFFKEYNVCLVRGLVISFCFAGSDILWNSQVFIHCKLPYVIWYNVMSVIHCVCPILWIIFTYFEA